MIVVAIVFISQAIAGQTKEITCSGKVVDTESRPIAGARVSLYQVTYDNAANTAKPKLTGEVRTTRDGLFSFKAVVEDDGYQNGYIIAEKEELALGWADWEMRDSQQRDIILGEPKELSGMVIDETGKPVPDADVSVWLIAVGEEQDQQRLGRPLAEKFLTVATDTSGRFTFTNIPAEATADFIIRKTGRATLRTYRSTGYANQKLTFAPGQADIKLVLSAEARIQGTIMAKDTGNPVVGIKLMVTGQGNRPLFGQEPVISKDDGTFSIDALVAGTYLVQLVRPRDGLAEWVSEPVKVKLEAGQTKKDVKIELRKGGFLEVLIAEAETNKPLDKASVSIRDERNNRWVSAKSNEDGIARIRLMPGGYQISGVYRQGYMSDRRQEAVTIKEGETKGVICKLNEMPKINGVVRDMADNPIEGVDLKILPGGREEVRSDSEGKFEIIWDQRFWGEREDMVFCLVARHEQRNLAAALEIGDDMKTLDLKLEPGIIFAGKVVDLNGKGIPGARIMPWLQVSNWGSLLSERQAETDDNGNFEIRAIPADHEYRINANARGYGEKEVEIPADNTVGDHLDVGALILPLANLSVSGQIVDTQGNPVAHAGIESSGEGQPRLDTRADTEGKFTLDGVCAGKVRIRADVIRDARRLSAHVFTDAGATDIKIVVREGRSVIHYIRTKTYEQIIQSGEKVIAGVAVDQNDSPVAGVPVGVRCIKREREDGKFSWTFSDFSALSDITDKQGRFAIELEEDAQYNLRFSPDNHAALIVYDIPVGKKDLKVILPEGGTITGRLVRMENGKKIPIPNVEVKLEQEDRASYTHLGFDRDRTAITDSQGRFQFVNVQTKIRPHGSMSQTEWEHIPRVWLISYGDTSKSIAFYDGTTIDDFELLVGSAEEQTLMGKVMPGFDGIKINLNEDQTEGKRMLVCFWDMNQRPSRNCLMRLNKRARELQKKDISAVAVQTLNIDEKTLDEWVKKNNITFPVGMIQNDVEKTRFTWGVKALPWLILTDKKRIVQAEGFGINELDEKITTLKEK